MCTYDIYTHICPCRAHYAVRLAICPLHSVAIAANNLRPCPAFDIVGRHLKTTWCAACTANPAMRRAVGFPIPRNAHHSYRGRGGGTGGSLPVVDEEASTSTPAPAQLGDPETKERLRRAAAEIARVGPPRSEELAVSDEAVAERLRREADGAPGMWGRSVVVIGAGQGQHDGQADQAGQSGQARHAGRDIRSVVRNILKKNKDEEK